MVLEESEDSPRVLILDGMQACDVSWMFLVRVQCALQTLGCSCRLEASPTHTRCSLGSSMGSSPGMSFWRYSHTFRYLPLMLGSIWSSMNCLLKAILRITIIIFLQTHSPQLGCLEDCLRDVALQFVLTLLCDLIHGCTALNSVNKGNIIDRNGMSMPGCSAFASFTRPDIAAMCQSRLHGYEDKAITPSSLNVTLAMVDVGKLSLCMSACLRELSNYSAAIVLHSFHNVLQRPCLSDFQLNVYFLWFAIWLLRSSEDQKIVLLQARMQFPRYKCYRT